MKKRRPTARDRNIADYFINLPIGEHKLIMEDDNLMGIPPLKAEGGALIRGLPRGKRLAVLPQQDWMKKPVKDWMKT